MSITWGDIPFEGHEPILNWNPPRKAAVYAIIVLGSKANHYKVIYFGESGNLSEI